MSEMWINMGPQHPMTHGLWNLRIKVDGERVVDAQPEIGYLHRGVEKIAEIKTYQEFIPLSDRAFCYAAAMSWEMTYIGTVEKMMNIEIPKRASYIRVIMLEMQRIASHLLWLSSWCADLGLLTMFLYAMRERELFLDLMQMVTGGRMHYVYMRFGGVVKDLPEDFVPSLLDALDKFENRLDDYHKMMSESDAFLLRTVDRGILDKDHALEMGVTGANLRACGVKKDARRDFPYLNYKDFDFEIPIGKKGDTFDRYVVRMEEMKQSIKIIRQAAKNLPEGDFKLAEVPRAPPKGTGFFITEDPRGMAAMYIESDGSLHPYRLKARSPTYFNIGGTLPEIVLNERVADVPSIVGSIDVCLGEVDR